MAVKLPQMKMPDLMGLILAGAVLSGVSVHGTHAAQGGAAASSLPQSRAFGPSECTVIIDQGQAYWPNPPAPPLLVPGAYAAWQVLIDADILWHEIDLGNGGSGWVSAADNQFRTEGDCELRATVAGTLLYQERIALPPTALVTVALEDVSRADAPSVTVALTSFTAGGRQVPLPFELSYDPSTIDERYRYNVRATIAVDGRVQFRTTQTYPVLTQGSPSSVVLVLTHTP
jgi:putative lipoprotein